MNLTPEQLQALKECLPDKDIYRQVLAILGVTEGEVPEETPVQVSTKPLSNGKFVLVVDDEPTVSSFIQIVLEHQGFEVKVAPNGAQCLAALMERVPDLIIIDIGLPDMDGGDLCQRVRQTPNGPQIPVIFVSGLLLQMEADDLNREQKDKTYYVGKPFTAYKLIESVSRFLPPAS